LKDILIKRDFQGRKKGFSDGRVQKQYKKRIPPEIAL
jgi:hypothetical protein